MLKNENIQNKIKNEISKKTDIDSIPNGIDTENENENNQDENFIEKKNLNANLKLENFSVEDACKMVKKVFRAAAEREISVRWSGNLDITK